MYIIGKGVIGEELITSFKKKNLLQGVIWLKGFINQSGTVEENATYKNAMYTEQYIKINSKKTYSANFDIANFRMRCYSNSKKFIGTTLTLNNFPTNTVYIRIVALYGIPSENLIIKEVQTDENNDKVFKDWETGVLWSLDNGKNVINTAWERTPVEKQQTIKANTKYIYSIASGTSAYTTIGFYDKDSNYISRTINKTFTTPDNAYYVRISAKTTDTSLKILIKPDTSENLIKNINTPKTFTFGSSAFLGVQKDYTGLLKINKTYTIGFKIKAENTINANFRICNINTWTSVHSNMQKVEPNGDYVDVRYKFISSLEDCRVALGAYNYIKGETFSIKDMFLIQGDYTNKKLPDSLFK